MISEEVVTYLANWLVNLLEDDLQRTLSAVQGVGMQMARVARAEEGQSLPQERVQIVVYFLGELQPESQKASKGNQKRCAPSFVPVICWVAFLHIFYRSVKGDR